MKRVPINSDIHFKVNDIRGIGEHFTITFYTTNEAVNITKTDANVIDGKIVLNGSELMTLGAGVLNYTLENIEQNANFNDGYFNSSSTGTTDYYLQGGVIIPDGDEQQTVMDIVNGLAQSLANEVQRSTTQDTTHTTDISALVAEIQNLTTALQELNTRESGHYGELYNKWITDHYPFLALQTKVANMEENISENEDVIAAAFNDLREIIRDNEETIAAALNEINAKTNE